MNWHWHVGHHLRPNSKLYGFNWRTKLPITAPHTHTTNTLLLSVNNLNRTTSKTRMFHWLSLSLRHHGTTQLLRSSRQGPSLRHPRPPPPRPFCPKVLLPSLQVLLRARVNTPHRSQAASPWLPPQSPSALPFHLAPRPHAMSLCRRFRPHGPLARLAGFPALRWPLQVQALLARGALRSRSQLHVPAGGWPVQQARPHWRGGQGNRRGCELGEAAFGKV